MIGGSNNLRLNLFPDPVGFWHERVVFQSVGVRAANVQ